MPASRTRAFTLIELLAVVAIIAMLVAVLVTALAGARGSSTRLACAVKQRNLYGHTQTYMIDNVGKIPYGRWRESTSKQRSWDDVLLRYVDPGISPTDADATVSNSETLAFLCPDDEVSDRRSYTMPRTRQNNENLGIAVDHPSAGAFTSEPPPQFRMGQIQQPAQVMFITERLMAGRNILGNSGVAIIDGPDEHYLFTEERLHPPQVNYLMLDGHVESLLPADTIGTGTMAAPRGLWTRESGD